MVFFVQTSSGSYRPLDKPSITNPHGPDLSQYNLRQVHNYSLDTSFNQLLDVGPSVINVLSGLADCGVHYVFVGFEFVRLTFIKKYVYLQSFKKQRT